MRKAMRFWFWFYAVIALLSALGFFVGFFWTDDWKLTVMCLAINLSVSRQLNRPEVRP